MLFVNYVKCPIRSTVQEVIWHQYLSLHNHLKISLNLIMTEYWQI